MKVSHRITRLVTAGLIAGALAAPAASARPVTDPPIPNGSGPVFIEPAPAPVVQSVDEGLDWASAAIGAGAAGGLILLIGVGSSTYRHRREHVGVAH
jgi:hypothetical protein